LLLGPGADVLWKIFGIKKIKDLLRIFYAFQGAQGIGLQEQDLAVLGRSLEDPDGDLQRLLVALQAIEGPSA
jgi:hypothetical protein